MFYGSIEYLRDIFSEDKYELFLTCHDAYVDLFKSQFNGILPVDYRRMNIDPLYRFTVLKKLREKYYDIAIDPVGSEECWPNVYVMNSICADKKIGILAKQDKKYQCPAWLRNKIYDVVFYEDKNIHKIKHYTNFCNGLGEQNYEAKIAQIQIKETLKLPEHYFVVFPSASAPAKCWPIERYAEIATQIYQEKQWQMLVCGTKSDRDITERLLNLIPQIPTVNMLEKTTIMELIEVIGRSDLVITNDTSVYHIAVAAKRNICIVSGAYVYDQFLDYISNGYDLKANIRIVAHKSECMNCGNHCIYRMKTVYPCLMQVTTDEVMDAVLTLI